MIRSYVGECHERESGNEISPASFAACEQQLKDQKGSIKGDYLGKYYRAIYLVLKNMEGLTALRSICEVSPETKELLLTEKLGASHLFNITDSKEFPLMHGETFYAVKPVLELNFLRKLSVNTARVGVVCFERDKEVYKTIASNAEICILSDNEGKVTFEKKE